MKPLTIFVSLISLCLVYESIGLIHLYRNLSGYRDYWHDLAGQTSESDTVYYVALGDSAAQGIGASSPEKGYVGLIAQRIEANTGKPVHVVNLSVSGARVQGVLNQQIPELQQLNLPADTIVTLDIGGNDVGQWDEAEFESSMRKLMSQLPPQTVVADIAYFGVGRKRNLEGNVISANQIIHRLADDHKLRVAPLHEVTARDKNLLTLSVDLFHPSNRAYRNWYRAFWSVLDDSEQSNYATQ